MGLRSLIELNHDTFSVIEQRPNDFVYALASYVRSGSKTYTMALATLFDVRVVAMRHSSNEYYIPADSFGFPAKLPWDDHEQARDKAIAAAKELTGGKLASRDSMKEMILQLVQIIERQNEVLDDI